ATLARFVAVRFGEIRRVGERLPRRNLETARTAHVEHALHVRRAQTFRQRPRVFLERRRGKTARVRTRRDRAHHRVGATHYPCDAFGVRRITLHQTHARVGRLHRIRIANHSSNLMTAANRLGDDALSDVSGGTKYDEPHKSFLRVDYGTI